MSVKKIIEDIIAREGGYVNHPADRGGPTNYGITRRSYAEYFKCPINTVTIQDISTVTPKLAEKIYLTLYYVRPKIASLHPDIQPIMLDMAVHHGCVGAIKIMQTALTYLYNPGKIDGIIGPATIAAAKMAAENHLNYFLNKLVDRRIIYVEDIIINDPSQAVFEDGWIARAESFRPSATA